MNNEIRSAMNDFENWVKKDALNAVKAENYDYTKALDVVMLMSLLEEKKDNIGNIMPYILLRLTSLLKVILKNSQMHCGTKTRAKIKRKEPFPSFYI